MVKGDGGGLYIDSDPFRLFFEHRRAGTLIKPSSSALVQHHDAPPRNPPSLLMDDTFKFPVNLNSGETDGPPPPGEDSSGNVKHEMDFFAISRSKTLNQQHHEIDRNKTSSDNNVNTGLNLLLINSPAEDGGVSPNPKTEVRNQVAGLQSEVELLAGENQRLRDMLSQATTDYNSLHMQLIAVMEEIKKKCDNKKKKAPIVVPRQFMDLGIGGDTTEDNSRCSPDERSLDPTGANNTELEATSKGVGKRMSSRLRDRSPDQKPLMGNSKVPRFSSPTKNVDQAATETTMRKARVSVRVRTELNMISDGCQWRKYGQKSAKGNPYPRGYYRCTMSGNCPVRKQVQRCAEDKTILVTSYEGNHNHPLPPAAMTMASTTSSASHMLLSGSMSTTNSLMNTNFLATTHLPCSSTIATISASAPFPTITLDLTQNPNSDTLLQTPTNQLFMNPSETFPNPSAPLLPQIFRQTPLNQTKFSGLQTSQDLKGASSENQIEGSDSLTAAIAADPNFTAALAAAISSIMGGSSGSTSKSTK